MTKWLVSSKPVDYLKSQDIMQWYVKKIIHHNYSDLIWLLEHPDMYSAGTSANPKDLIDANKFKVYKSGRGGKYTYHGIGQRVIYTMIDLNKQNKDIRWFISSLENWIIRALQDFNLDCFIKVGKVGIWVNTLEGDKKIGAIGIRISKWVSMHGISLNINPNLENFNGIIPCGVSDFKVSSLYELGVKITKEEFDKQIKKYYGEFFNE